MTTTLEDKKQILIDGFAECMKNHLCGNYIGFSDIEGLESSDIEWAVDTDNLSFIAYTEFGVVHYEYDYFFNFDQNLEGFVEEVRDYLMDNVRIKE